MAFQPSNPVVVALQPSIPSYRLTTSIAGDPYIFDVKWNPGRLGQKFIVPGAWYFDLYEIDETPIACGLKIVLGGIIGRRVQHPLFQFGAFVACDLSAATPAKWRDAGFDDLGTRVQLRYYTVYDIMAAARTANGQG